MGVVEVLEKIITIDTTNPPGKEKVLSDWIAGYLAPYGFEIEQPACGENRTSVIAKLHRGTGPKLVMNGHLDIVPAGSGWITDPFVAVRKNGRVYGRGSADMKGGVAAMICAGIEIAKHPDGIQGELCLVFVADEEIINLGTISCRHGWEDADYVVIGEPTELRIEIAHKGTARFEIIVRGKSCHSGMPWRGVNAIEKAAKVLEAIQRCDHSLESIAHPLLSRPSVAVTMIRGGEKDNILPGDCSIMIDYRMVPGDTGDAVEKTLIGYLDTIKEEDMEFEYSIRRYINLEPGEIPIGHPWVKKTKKVYNTVFHKKPVIKAFPATCEQVLFVKAGIPAVVIGPGSIEQAHVANEFVEILQLEQAAAYYEALARDVLKKKQETFHG